MRSLGSLWGVLVFARPLLRLVIFTLLVAYEMQLLCSDVSIVGRYLVVWFMTM